MFYEYFDVYNFFEWASSLFLIFINILSILQWVNNQNLKTFISIFFLISQTTYRLKKISFKSERDLKTKFRKMKLLTSTYVSLQFCSYYDYPITNPPNIIALNTTSYKPFELQKRIYTSNIFLIFQENPSLRISR